jgi:hypothetical protein
VLVTLTPALGKLSIAEVSIKRQFHGCIHTYVIENIYPNGHYLRPLESHLIILIPETKAVVRLHFVASRDILEKGNITLDHKYLESRKLGHHTILFQKQCQCNGLVTQA